MSNPLKLVTDEVARRGQIPTENQIRNAIVEYLIYHGWLVIRINSGASVVVENGKRRWLWFVKWSILGEIPQTAGVADLLAFHPDKAYPPLAIETKRPGNTPTEAQKRFMAEWKRHGGKAIIATGIEDLQKVIGD